MLSERNTSDFNITDKDGKPRTTPCTRGKGLPQLVPCAVISAFLNVFGKSLLLDTLMATFIPATKTFPELPS